jgi:hypothetical protein
MDQDLDPDEDSEDSDEVEESYDYFPQIRMNAIIKNKGGNRWSNNEMPYEISKKYAATE